MADVSYNIQAQVSKGALSQTFAAGGITANISTAGLLALTLNLGTSVTQISTATLNSLGICFARSLATSSTHTVSFGRYSGSTLYETVELRGGEAALLRLSPGSYAAKAAVEGTRLLVNVMEG